VIGNALRVRTGKKVFNFLWQGNSKFFYNFEITNNIDTCFGRKDSDPIRFINLDFVAADFD
jgi:hypothetical protein